MTEAQLQYLLFYNESPLGEKKYGDGEGTLAFFLLSTQFNYIPNGEFVISYLAHNEYSM